MKWVVQLTLSEEGQQALAHYVHALQQVEDLSTVTLTLAHMTCDIVSVTEWLKSFHFTA